MKWIALRCFLSNCFIIVVLHLARVRRVCVWSYVDLIWMRACRPSPGPLETFAWSPSLAGLALSTPRGARDEGDECHEGHEGSAEGNEGHEGYEGNEGHEGSVEGNEGVA